MTKCPKCESEDTMRFGFNYFKDKRVQKFKCLACNKIFSYEHRLPKTHVSSEIVALCFDLYMKGLSYRVIRQQILEQFQLNISHVAIYRWIQTYTKLMEDYLKRFQPKLSAVWQMDETYIKFKGIKPTTDIKRSEGHWCWVGIDTGTRFVLDMHLSDGWDQSSCYNFFESMRQKTNCVPKVICTDGNASYKGVIRNFSPSAKLVFLEKKSIAPSASFIERFNGTIKNRTKTMRCFDEFYPCQTTLSAFRLYYNYLRPHMALDGRTPAEEADIRLDLKNRWISLIRQAMSC